MGLENSRHKSKVLTGVQRQTCVCAVGGGPEEKQRAPRGRCEGRNGPRRARASGRMDGGIVLTRGKDEEEEEEDKQPHIQQGG